MEQVKLLSHDIAGSEDLALIKPDDSVWIVLNVRWWNLLAVLRWAMTPRDAAQFVQLKGADGKVARMHAVRVATRHVRVGTPKKT